MIRTIHNQFNADLYDLEAVRKLESLGFVDDSWGNDSCPKMRYEGRGYRVLFWIETREPDSREIEASSQFQIQVQVGPFGVGSDRGRWYPGSESFDAALSLLPRDYSDFTSFQA